MHTYQVADRAISALKLYSRNARTHSKKQIKQIARSIERFGFTNPVLISDDGEIIAGHGRVEAAKSLGWKAVPTLALSHLSETERRAYVLADNKLALNAGWNKEILAIELQALVDLEFDTELTGFSLAEIDLVLDEASDADPDQVDGEDDQVSFAVGPAVSRQGDIWQLGRHRLLCGDARSAIDFEALMSGEVADLVFTDPPYNVKIDGNVCGLGTVKHREFAFASGEMSQSQFTTFLTDTLGNAASVMRDGAIAFVCMDWRHMGELLAAGQQCFTELKNLVVWSKTNGGMGAFYRSKHELVFVFKQGTAEHTNSFGLGDTGRYRTNVWDYAGISSISGSRSEELAMHPTVKPVALIADAIRDCSRRGEVVLDCFGGSGSTLIAAEKTGRAARLPLVLKGIIRPDDAVMARDHGADAIIVSNHAGQGLRSSQPVAHALPAIAEAVGSEIEVYADSGIRTGADVLRALALGAKSVLIGRPTLWGLAAGGAAGVQRVLQILQAELAEVMAITGAACVADIDASVLGARCNSRQGKSL